MPRRGSHPAPVWNRLYRLAAPQGGLFTLAQARGVGYSGPLVEYHLRVGHLERAGRGIFRLVQFPPGEHEDLIVVWLWSEQRGVFSHETALALHDLSDALPAKKHLTVPAEWTRRRLRVPPGVILHHADLARAEVTWTGPVPVTSALRTVVDCALGSVDPILVRRAKAQAKTRGLFTKLDLDRALATRRGREATP